MISACYRLPSCFRSKRNIRSPLDYSNILERGETLKKIRMNQGDKELFFLRKVSHTSNA